MHIIAKPIIDIIVINDFDYEFYCDPDWKMEKILIYGTLNG